MDFCKIKNQLNILYIIYIRYTKFTFYFFIFLDEDIDFEPEELPKTRRAQSFRIVYFV